MHGLKQHNLSSTRKEVLTFLGILFYFFTIMLWAPMAYDDFDFISRSNYSVSEIFQYSLHYGNGRLFGNMGVIILLRSPLFCALAKALTITLTLILIPKILGIRSSWALPMTFILLCAVDAELFSQIFTWTSGFQNYTPPIMLSLSALYLIQAYTQVSSRISRLALCAFISVIGLASQLYIEHSSLIHVLLAFIVIVKVILDSNHKGLLPSLIYLFSLVIGLLIMFWIPKHFYVTGNDVENYRSIQLSSIYQLLTSCARNGLRLTNHYFGLLGLPVCFSAAITVDLTKSHRSNKWNQRMLFFSLCSAACMVIIALMQFQSWYSEMALVYHIFAMLDVVSVFLIWIIAAFQLDEPLLQKRILVLIGLCLAAQVPLLIVIPIKIRLTYHSYISVIMAFLILLEQYLNTLSFNIKDLFFRILRIGTVLFSICLAMVFFSMNTMAQTRHQYIKQELANGATNVDYFDIPIRYLNAENDRFITQYYYQNVPGDVTFHSIPYDEWKNRHYSSVHR